MPAAPKPVEFPLLPSAVQRHGWWVSHALVAVLALAVAAGAAWQLAAVVGIAVSALVARRRSRRAVGWRHLRWHDGELCLINGAGEHCGRLRKVPLVLPKLILLEWDGPEGVERLALFNDSAAPNDLRRLRVRLSAWRRRH